MSEFRYEADCAECGERKIVRVRYDRDGSVRFTECRDCANNTKREPQTSSDTPF